MRRSNQLAIFVAGEGKELVHPRLTVPLMQPGRRFQKGDVANQPAANLSAIMFGISERSLNTQCAKTHQILSTSRRNVVLLESLRVLDILDEIADVVDDRVGLTVLGDAANDAFAERIHHANDLRGRRVSKRYRENLPVRCAAPSAIRG